MTLEVTLKTTDDVKYLNDVAFDYGEKILVSDKSYTVDARSILALFSLIGTPINLVFPDHCNVKRLENIVKKLAVLA